MAKEKTIHTGFRIPESVKAKLLQIAEAEKLNLTDLLNQGALLRIKQHRNSKNMYR